ncbi:glycosyltransferase [Rhodobacteraceae bacterium CY05]|uniref:Glycosyltransferase n=2 Tax=Parasedimentitalea huanghaiensis TaxID=2682100 RepID=A0A6L6WAA4_9RHOB|nr:glycosyltransferase [Zongyanglinia huanghaiensis]
MTEPSGAVPGTFSAAVTEALRYKVQRHFCLRQVEPSPLPAYLSCKEAHMKILLIAIGSRGDVQPFVVLGNRLKAEGHDVHIAAAEGFSAMISEAGLAHHPLPMDLQDLMQSPEIKSALTSFSGKIKAYRWTSEIMNQQLSAMWQIGMDVAPGLILYHFKGALAPYLARKLGIPAWPIMLQPGFTATRQYPQFLVASRSLGRVGNLASHKAIGALIKVGTNLMIKRWIKASGTDIGPMMDVQAGYAPDGLVTRPHAYSPHITPLAPDMSEAEKQVGYIFAKPEEFTPPPALQSFLTEGPKPIYVGFGSMPGIDHQRINTALLGALEQTGIRAVVATGWGGFADLSPGPNIHVLEAVPHTWLFPRVAAVVHHGGSGTTHEGLRWGRPSVVCPLFADQPFFGQRVADLGVGPAPIAQKRLTADKLASALEAVLSPEMTAKAETLGASMKHEDGAGKMAELIAQIDEVPS